MKKVLSSLMAFVLLQAQSFALVGGPVFGGPATINVIGTFAGVLIPEESDDKTDLGKDNTSAASIGLFSLGVPETGPAFGSAILFVDGAAFTGTIIGVADPSTARLRGIIDAASTFVRRQTVQTGVDTNGQPIFEVVESHTFAQGSIDTTIFNFGTQQGPFPAAGTIRLAGTAEVDVFGKLEDDGTPLVSNTTSYIVDGFKQSETATTVDLTFGSNFDFDTN